MKSGNLVAQGHVLRIPEHHSQTRNQSYFSASEMKIRRDASSRNQFPKSAKHKIGGPVKHKLKFAKNKYQSEFSMTEVTSS